MEIKAEKAAPKLLKYLSFAPKMFIFRLKEEKLKRDKKKRHNLCRYILLRLKLYCTILKEEDLKRRRESAKIRIILFGASKTNAYNFRA